MLWDTDFELKRLLLLLTERLAPGCAGQTLTAEDVEDLIVQIHREGEKISLEVMKVMCRAYAEEHLKRYLEVHLAGVEYLQQKMEALMEQATAHCLQLFEAMCNVLEEVLDFLSFWRKRCFGIMHGKEAGDGTVTADDLMRPKEVMSLLDISEKTLYNYTIAGEFEYRQIKGTKYYVRSSVLGFKKNKDK